MSSTEWESFGREPMSCSFRKERRGRWSTPQITCSTHYGERWASTCSAFQLSSNARRPRGCVDQFDFRWIPGSKSTFMYSRGQGISRSNSPGGSDHSQKDFQRRRNRIWICSCCGELRRSRRQSGIGIRRIDSGTFICLAFVR